VGTGNVPDTIAHPTPSVPSVASEHLTSPGTALGTVAYMSPEQVCAKELDGRTDLFSFGVVLYEMATGRLPFPGASPGLIADAILIRDPVAPVLVNPAVSPALQYVILRALEKDRALRYQHASDMRAALQRLQRDAQRWKSEEGTEAKTTLITGSSSANGKRRARNSVQATESGSRRASKVINSLAVLPFENASGDPEHEYLSEGITGSLINILASVPKLRVMAQSTVSRYKGRSVDPQAIGRELNVRAVLMGKMMQSQGSLRIGAELVDVVTGCQLWGAHYDRESGEIFKIQDEISSEISEKLRLQLSRSEKKRLTRRQTENAEAYRLYLQGRHHWNKWTEEGFYKAIDYFRQAVGIDPKYALAFAGVADSYVLLGWNSYIPAKEAFPAGKAAALTALKLDPNLAEAHASLAVALWLHDWQWEEAQTEFKRSLALSPTYATANHWFAEYTMTMGRHEEALARMRKSQELDPLSLIISVAVGWALYNARRYDDAIDQMRRAVDLDPHYPVTYWILGLLFRITGRYEMAIAEGEKAVKLSNGSPMMCAALAQTFAASGRKKEALTLLEHLKRLAEQKYVAPHFLAGIHVALGESDLAFEYLEKSYERHSHWLIYLHLDPGMDSLRDDPRFEDLVQRVGLSSPAVAISA
jgi:TolB-like protein/Tfp pilus assembly protein PilF